MSTSFTKRLLLSPCLLSQPPNQATLQQHPWCCSSISVFLLELLLSFISFLSLRYTTLTPSNVCPKRRCWHANIMLPGTDGGYTGNQQRETKCYHSLPPLQLLSWWPSSAVVMHATSIPFKVPHCPPSTQVCFGSSLMNSSETSYSQPTEHLKLKLLFYMFNILYMRIKMVLNSFVRQY